jgi:chemotaxis protein CheC
MLSASQLSALTILFRHGADDASAALSRWLGRPATIVVEQIEQLGLTEAAGLLSDPEEPVCACAMSLQGGLSGELLLVFDDPSGLALADLLLSRPVGTSKSWDELERSAALETANIVGCAYLNSLSRMFPAKAGGPIELLPSPPRFVRDFAESLMQFVLMNQAIASDAVFLTRTAFHIDDAPVEWSLLFVPDAASFSVLREMLG